MATTVTRKDMNICGNLIEDVFDFTIESGDEDSGAIQTRLHWIKHVDIVARGGHDISAVVSINSTTQSTAQGDPGAMIVSQITDPTEDATFQCRVLGW